MLYSVHGEQTHADSQTGRRTTPDRTGYGVALAPVREVSRREAGRDANWLAGAGRRGRTAGAWRMIAGVYAIINTVTGHRYIGSTKNFRVRSGTHRWGLNTGNLPNKPLRAAWAEHGREAFLIQMLEETAADDDTLETAERRWIEHFVAM